MRARDDPQRHEQRQGGAERNNKRLKLWRVSEPSKHQKAVGLAWCAGAFARGVGGVVEGSVGKHQLEHDASGESDENNDAGNDEAAALLRCSCYGLVHNSSGSFYPAVARVRASSHSNQRVRAHALGATEQSDAEGDEDEVGGGDEE